MSKESLVTQTKDFAVGVAKALPIISGALGGLFVRPHGGSYSPYEAVVNKATGTQLADSVLANYTFYSMNDGAFHFDQGRGVKLLGAGLVISKIFNAIIDA